MKLDLSSYQSTPLLMDALILTEDRLCTVENHSLYQSMDTSERLDFYTLMGICTFITDPEIQKTPDKSGVILMTCELMFGLLNDEYLQHPNTFSQDPLISYVPILTHALSGHVKDKALMRHVCTIVMNKVKSLPCVSPLIPGASDLIAACEKAIEKLINCIGGGSNG